MANGLTNLRRYYNNEANNENRGLLNLIQH